MCEPQWTERAHVCLRRQLLVQRCIYCCIPSRSKCATKISITVYVVCNEFIKLKYGVRLILRLYITCQTWPALTDPPFSNFSLPLSIELVLRIYMDSSLVLRAWNFIHNVTAMTYTASLKRKMELLGPISQNLRKTATNMRKRRCNKYTQ